MTPLRPRATLRSRIKSILPILVAASTLASLATLKAANSDYNASTVPTNAVKPTLSNTVQISDMHTLPLSPQQYVAEGGGFHGITIQNPGSQSLGSITFSVGNTNIAQVTNISSGTGTLKFTGAGTTTVVATQAPWYDVNTSTPYAGASITNQLIVTKGKPSITISLPTNSYAYSNGLTLHISSSLFGGTNFATVTSSPTSLGIATNVGYMVGGTVTPVYTLLSTLAVKGVGTITITASQPGDTNYSAAPPVTKFVIIN